MLRWVDLRDGDPRRRAGGAAGDLPRARLGVAQALAAVREICEDVRDRGDTAVLAAGERLDGVRPAGLVVPPEELAAAAAALPSEVRAALAEAAARVRRVHEAQLRADVTIEVAPGLQVRTRYEPVSRVGLYVPGGRVAYPSSVVMNVVPAQVAGVDQVAVSSPPTRENGGWPHPVILGACGVLGVSQVYAAGGAQAIAMFAYGTASCPPVDLVTGPGNVYVAAAKRFVRGQVGTDGEAGATEVAILADEAADPASVAADLIAQAEHDPLAACVLVTDSPGLIAAVEAELAHQVPGARHQELVRQALAGQGAAVCVRDLTDALAVIEAYAPEHLEILTRDAAGLARRVRGAGAIFIGPFTPVALGDYLAGSNHVLPTGGTARFASGLSADTFRRLVYEVQASRAALAAAADHLVALASAEDLDAHAAAVSGRLRAGPVLRAPEPARTPEPGRLAR